MEKCRCDGRKHCLVLCEADLSSPLWGKLGFSWGQGRPVNLNPLIAPAGVLPTQVTDNDSISAIIVLKS